MAAKIKYLLKEEQKEINENLSYIMGVIFGDAYACYNELKGVYFIGLETKDKDFALKFKKELEIWSKGYVSLRERTRKFNHTSRYNNKFDCISDTYIVTFNSKMFSKFILDFKHYFIEELKEKNSQQCIRNFLLGFYDSEGHIGIQKQIGLTHKKKELLEEVKGLLIKIGFKKIPIYEKEKGRYYQIILCGRKNLKIFRQEIGFTIIRKKEKLNNLLTQFKNSKI